MDHDNDAKKTPDTTLPMAETCTGKLEIPTPREQEALARLKSIKERVRVLKAALSSSKANDQPQLFETISNAEKELALLKEDWETWEAERKAAAKERMIILGHEDP